MKNTESSATQPVANRRSTSNSVVTAFPDIHRSRSERRQHEKDQALEALKSQVDLLELKANIMETPELDAARVVDLHNRIASGEYTIRSDRLASKLISLESSLDP